MYVYLPDIDPSSPLPEGVSLPELCHHTNGVQSSILSQSEWDHLHSLSECPYAVGLHPCQRLRVFHQPKGYLSLGGPSSCYQGSVKERYV